MRTKWSKTITVRADKHVDLQTFYRYINEQGLKFSKRRAAVIEYFVNADRHFTVEQLHIELRKKYPGLGYSTVYRTLKLLVDSGVATVHHFGEEDARFELVHKEEHHDHFVCRQCGRIVEFHHRGIERLQHKVARSLGFTVDEHELQLFGLCGACQETKTKSGSKQ